MQMFLPARELTFPSSPSATTPSHALIFTEKANDFPDNKGNSESVQVTLLPTDVHDDVLPSIGIGDRCGYTARIDARRRSHVPYNRLMPYQAVFFTRL
jgi:hypothetical protein